MGEDSNCTVLPTEDPVKVEFYSTYDVMTGIRIAATLAGFFSLMMLLAAYKTKCKSRSLSDEKLEAAVAVVVEQGLGKALSVLESRRAGRARVSVPYVYPTPRCSPPPDPRPPTRPERAAPDLLEVPDHLRRLSSLTCSSCDTSYLERRGSAMELGLPITPPLPQNRSRLSERAWHFYYPIDIQVIQPTPQVSPCHSQSDRMEGGLRPGVAPLASIGSLGLATEDDEATLGSDSVFLDEELVDTEDEVEGFSTDSDTEVGPPSRQSRVVEEVAIRRLSTTSCKSCESETVCGVQPGLSASCDQLVKALRASSSKSALDHCSWSRETLF